MPVLLLEAQCKVRGLSLWQFEGSLRLIFMPLDPKCSPKAGKASHLRSGEAAKPQMAEKVYCFRFGVRGLGLGSTGLGFREAPNTPKP